MPLQERLGVELEKEDEMDCAVAGCNFFLKAITSEAFSYEDNQPRFMPTQGAPVLLVAACLWLCTQAVGAGAVKVALHL